MRYIDPVSTAELDFGSSLGYPTCLYLSHMVQWPDGHKWPNMAKMVIYGHLASEPCATNICKWSIPEKSYRNLAQQCQLEKCNALLADFIAKRFLRFLHSITHYKKRKPGESLPDELHRFQKLF